MSRRALRRRRTGGQAIIEYALLIMLASLICMGILFRVGGSVKSALCQVSTGLNNGIPDASCAGSSWHQAAALGTVGGDLTRMSCTSTSFCMALHPGLNASSTTYNGSSWSTPITGPQNAGPLSCVDSNHCYNINDGSAAYYNSGTWTQSVGTPNLTAFDGGLSCLSTSFCMGAGAAFVNDDAVQSWDGSSWSAMTDVLAGGGGIHSVSCVTPTWCMAVDNTGNAILYNGATWTASNIDGTTIMRSVSCLNPTSPYFCMAVDTDGNAFLYNGVTWTASHIDGSNNIWSVSCVTATWCMAVDDKGNAINYNGAWQAPLSINYGSTLYEVSCVGTTFCMAGGQEPGGGGWVVQYNSGTWGTPTYVEGRVGNLNAVSCASTTFCMAVTWEGDVLTYAGTWSVPSKIDGDTAITDISCVSSSFCAAVDASGNALTYTGTWSGPTAIDSGNSITGVSCTSPTFCMVVDANGKAYKYTGAWIASFMGAILSPSAVSCTSTTFCMAVDSGGKAIKYTGAWGASTSIDNPNQIKSVSCTSTTFCMAVDANGKAIKYTGAWHPAAAIDGTKVVNSVSCASSSACEAVDANGNAIQYTGSWTGAASIDGTYSINGISCPSSTFCMAVDANGNEIKFS